MFYIATTYANIVDADKDVVGVGEVGDGFVF